MKLHRLLFIAFIALFSNAGLYAADMSLNEAIAGAAAVRW
jgi:hypothetical protein